jgi:hypothetical protein
VCTGHEPHELSPKAKDRPKVGETSRKSGTIRSASFTGRASSRSRQFTAYSASTELST